MKSITRRAALVSIAMGVGAAGAEARVFGRRIAGDRDLTPELTSTNSISEHRGNSRPVHISLMPIGPSSVFVGTPMTFRMVSSADSFGSVYALSASGRTQAWFENMHLPAGKPVIYPDRGLVVRATAPAGDETIIFLASRDRLEGFAGDGETRTPRELQYSHAGLRAALQQKLRELRRERWAFAEIKIRVLD